MDERSDVSMSVWMRKKKREESKSDEELWPYGDGRTSGQTLDLASTDRHTDRRLNLTE